MKCSRSRSRSRRRRRSRQVQYILVLSGDHMVCECVCVCELNARLCKGRAVYADTLLCCCLCLCFFLFIAVVVVSVAIAVVVAVAGGIVFCCCVSCRLNDNIVAILFAHNLLLFLEWMEQSRQGQGAKETLPTGRKRTNFSGRKH